ncbi:MAG: hypothetical protein IJ632_07950, partial [Muribaculaceae bacterium]|nr:hypothetical protein [Muribaculaceae bacterium]
AAEVKGRWGLKCPESKPNRRMPNGTYGGVGGKGAKTKTLAPRPTRLCPLLLPKQDDTIVNLFY